jgi:transposase
MAQERHQAGAKGSVHWPRRPATGRPSKLTPAQQAQVFRWINGKDPRQYGLDFGLWTRQIAATLIAQKFGVQLGVTAVGRVLARLGLTPQKPLQRAYQRDPQAIERWQRETYPGIACGSPPKRGRRLLLG